jgi:hypothetical protein
MRTVVCVHSKHAVAHVDVASVGALSLDVYAKGAAEERAEVIERTDSDRVGVGVDAAKEMDDLEAEQVGGVRALAWVGWWDAVGWEAGRRGDGMRGEGMGWDGMGWAVRVPCGSAVIRYSLSPVTKHGAYTDVSISRTGPAGRAAVAERR